MDLRCDITAEDLAVGSSDNRAILIDAVRAQRLILAVHADDIDSSDQILAELDDCSDCLRGIVTYLAGVAASFAEIIGGDRTLDQLQKQLCSAIDVRNAVI